MNDLSSVYRRVRALLAKTEENNCTEAEVLSAMAKAQSLIDQYNLDMYSIDEPDKLSYKVFKMQSAMKYPRGWRGNIGTVLGINTGVYVYYHTLQKEKDDYLVICGREETVQTVEHILLYLIKYIEKEGANFVKRHGYGLQQKREFCKGMSLKVCSRISSASNLSDHPNLPSILENQILLIKEDLGLEVKTVKRKIVKTSSILAAGYQEGDKVPLRPETKKVAG
jgi:hypothetical protein